MKGPGAALVFYGLMGAKRFLLWSILVGLALTGCAGTSPAPAATPGGAAPTASSDPWQSLARGMTAAQVRAALGQPSEVRPMQTAGAEIWVYRRTTIAGVDMVATHTEDMPYLDPATGQQRTVPNQVYSRETHIVQQELNLLMFEGKLTSWKATVRQERRYDD